MPEAVVSLLDRTQGEVVRELRRAWTEEQTGPADDPSYGARFADWWAAEAGRRLTWVATVGDEPVGMLNVTVFERMPRPGRAPSRWGYLGNAFVLAAWRDRGIGGALLDAALAHARAAGFARMVLSPSERSVPFYARAGFTPATSLLLHPLGAR
jgi:GNAT superfamily N-acetyltransferase